MKSDEVWVIFTLFNDLLLHKLRIPELENYCEHYNGQKGIAASYTECGVKC